MGKAQRNKARKQHAAETPPQYMVLEMAQAEPVPDPSFRPDPVGTALSPYTRRELSYSVNAWQFLLNYLSYVKDGGFEVPAADFAPRRPEETEDDARMRILKAQKDPRGAVGSGIVA